MKNILLTGISGGLGIVIAKKLLEEDYKIFGISRKISKDLEILLKESNNRIQFLSYDLEDIENLKNLTKELNRLREPFYGFVNNAAYAYDDIVTNLNYEELLKMYKINVFSPFLLTKFVIRNMLLHNIKGSLVHISSISVHTGYKGLAMYASTKGALEAFSKNVGREWGERKIRSNSIVAGFMNTQMTSKLSDDLKDRIYNRTSLKSPTNPSSVAEMVSFLLSDKSESITGQLLFVDGGTI